MRNILITGGAGFLAFHIAQRLLEDPQNTVILVDNMNDYYSTTLKFIRMDKLSTHERCSTYRLDITDPVGLDAIFRKHKPEIVIHLAAQAGVRYSEVNPIAYATSNMLGTTVVFDVSKRHDVKHVLYASSSSVYGGSHDLPYHEGIQLTQPLSFYAVTKQANEMTAKSFTTQTGIQATGMRFFTAYGPYGRPDMAYWTFTENILAGKPITLYNGAYRDFTYCDDVAITVERLMDVSGDHQIYNIGNNSPVQVSDMISILENRLGVNAIIQRAPLPTSDPLVTACDNTKLYEATGFRPSTKLEDGLDAFVTWYLEAKDLI